MGVVATARAAARPAVSIVLPTHDRPILLTEAQRSVAGQTIRDWELIVVDDGSTPPVDLGRWDDDDRVHLIRNDRPVGGAASKALGAQHARGELVAFLDDDDLYSPELLGRAIAALDAHPGIDVLFIGVHWFGALAGDAVPEQAESMGRLLRIAAPGDDGAELLLFDERLFEGLLNAIPMDFQRIVVRRTALDRIGPHRADCLMWDCDWALRAAMQANCALLRSSLYLQRADGQEYFSKPGRERAQLESALEMTLRLHREPPPGTSARSLELLRAAASRHAGSLAYYHARHGPLGSSLSAWWRSARLRPGLPNPRLPLAALVHAARRRWHQEPLPR